MTDVSTFIPGWYAILPSHKLKREPVGITRFNIEIVLWRSENGEVNCFLDRCPHRGAKFSIGKIKNNSIECPFHGFCFNSDGACQLAPEFNKPLPGLKVKKISAKEYLGMIWVLYGEQEKVFDLSELNDLLKNFREGYCDTDKVWNSHITYCIENQLDYTHLPNVHKNTIGRGFKYPDNVVFSMDENNIRVSFHNKNPVLDFYFPNIWILNVSKKMKLAVYFAPINNHQTQLYLRTYHPLLRVKLFKFLLRPIFNKLNLIVLKQDQFVVQSQGDLPSYLASNDVLMRNDQAIQFFRKIWLAANK